MAKQITAGMVLKLWGLVVALLLLVLLVLWLGGAWGPVLVLAKWLAVAALVLPVGALVVWLFEAVGLGKK